MSRPRRAALETPRHYRRRLEQRREFLAAIQALFLSGQFPSELLLRPETVEVSLDQLEDALELVAKFQAQIPGDVAATIRYADEMNDATKLNASAAEILVQLAVFGRIIY
jgi:hypothetical protein